MSIKKSRKKEDWNSCGSSAFIKAVMRSALWVSATDYFSLSHLELSMQERRPKIFLLRVYRLGTRSCACIALLKLIEVSSLTSSEVLVLNIIWAVLCVHLLCLTRSIQRKCKQFLLQIFFNILCAEHTERLSFFTFLNFFFFNVTSYEMTGNMGSDYILTGSLLLQQPHIILDCVGKIFYAISKTLFQL